MRKIKKKYRSKKAGFSGTLDPFACGCLIVAFGQYPKLFQFLQKAPKTYRATIWLGSRSRSLDNENIYSIKNTSELNVNTIKQKLQNLKGSLEYLPPKYSAKKIDGKRAYDLTRSGINFEIKKIISEVFDVKFINYSHPFITFDVSVSEGSYIRSIAQTLLHRLDTVGTLSYLKRLNEGKFKYDNQKPLNPLEYLNLKTNNYTGTKEWFDLGKKLQIEYFDIKEDGQYLIKFDTFFAIIEIKELNVKYLLNKILLHDEMRENFD
ncbi:tRNA pseudouridine synthase B [hydrothermal vent metagenome]|uniref:tRNA pseudouridine(55) synthase n=1 Tax=hydrothermal vent metagenome TaxID=652676 RepID=A0A3B1E564_9ZZZZ